MGRIDEDTFGSFQGSAWYQGCGAIATLDCA